MNGNRRSRFGDIPVKEGDTYDVEIEGVGEKGDGIARVEGYVIIVPNVQKGDKVKVKINAVRGKVSFGEVVGEGEAKEEAVEEVTEENTEETTEEDASEEEPTEDAPEAETAEEPTEEASEEETKEAPEAEEPTEEDTVEEETPEKKEK